MDKEMLQKYLEFAEKAHEVCKGENGQCEFECPMCGGKAYASKSLLNGHLHAACTNCNAIIME